MPAPPSFTAWAYRDALAAARTDPVTVTSTGASLTWWQGFRVKYGHMIYWGVILAGAVAVLGLSRRRR